MKTLTDQLSQYAAYHRSRGNIATHFIGVPMIVVALQCLLSRPALEVVGLPLTFAMVASIVLAGYYLWLDIGLGLVVGLLLALGLGMGVWAASLSWSMWLALGVGCFVLGWTFQFLGHAAFERRKPAFLDDISGLVIGPLFVAAEALFLMGLRPALKASIEARLNGLRAA